VTLLLRVCFREREISAVGGQSCYRGTNEIVLLIPTSVQPHFVSMPIEKNCEVMMPNIWQNGPKRAIKWLH